MKDLKIGNAFNYKAARKELFEVFDERLFTDRKMENLIEEILRHPINLNRGIFDDKPIIINKDKFDKIDEKFAAWYLHAKSQNSKMQVFYNYELVFSDEDSKRKRSNVIQQINRVKIHDVYLSMIAESLFKCIFNMDVHVDLQTIFLSYDDRKKLQEEALAQKDRQSGDMSANIVKADQLWNTPIPMKIAKDRIYDDSVMIRDIGKFREVELDSRVQDILTYDATKSWERKVILNEIQSYDLVRREQLLKTVQNLEESILVAVGWTLGDKHPNILNHNSKDDGHPNFRKYILASKLFSALTETDKITLRREMRKVSIDDLNVLSNEGKVAYLCIMIRNKFAHNQMLSKVDYEILNSLRLCERKDGQSFSEYVYLCYEEIVKRIN